MPPEVERVEIAREPHEVFAYLDELARHSERQEQLVAVEVETEGPPRVGSPAIETRRVPRRPETVHVRGDRPRLAAKGGGRVLEGPVRPRGTLTVEPVEDGSRSLVTISSSAGGGLLLVVAHVPIVRGYGEALVDDLISRVRTDPEASSEEEIAVLENHGYLLAGAAVKTHVPELIERRGEVHIPHPDWMERGVRDQSLGR